MSTVRNQKYLTAFGKNFERIRKEKNISQENLALEAGIDYMQIYRIAHGKVNTTVSTIYAIAKALDVHPMEFLNFDFKD